MFGLGRHSPWLGLENERGERGWTWNINYPGDSPAAPPPLPASPKVPGMDGRINMHSPVDQRAPTRIPTESCTHLCAQPLHPLAWAHRDRKTERWENPLGCDKESMNSLPIWTACLLRGLAAPTPLEAQPLLKLSEGGCGEGWGHPHASHQAQPGRCVADFSVPPFLLLLQCILQALCRVRRMHSTRRERGKRRKAALPILLGAPKLCPKYFTSTSLSSGRPNIGAGSTRAESSAGWTSQ